MKTAVFSVAAAALSFAGSALAADVDPIIIKGSKFFYKTNGTEFFMRGIAYQQEYGGNGTGASGGASTSQNKYVDPLADISSCSRDIPELVGLRTNTIRTYAIDPNKNHDDCMDALANAGIYVVSDLSEPATSINRDQPQWDIELYDRYTSVIDVMAKYTNTLGFFAGNEVSNAVNNTAASAYVKAAVRDMKAYIKSKNYRQIGVGYAANDDAAIRRPLMEYFNCGPAEESIDFFGYNIYSWCGDSSFKKSGFDLRTKEFSTYNVPAFFAEYGCIDPKPREFTEIGTLYGDEMTPVWSGGIVYMYFQEANNYGVVSVDGDSVSRLEDYSYLSSQLASITPSGTVAGSYSPTNSAASCPTLGNEWAAASNLPPTPNQQLCSCMTKSLGCIAKSSISAETIKDTFDQVCGYEKGKYCKGIASNGEKGEYGNYSACKPVDKLSHALNAYYQGQNKAATACDFGGAAAVQRASSGEGNCPSLISQAGAAGTNSVSSGDSAATSQAAASSLVVPTMETLGLRAIVLVLVSALAGAGLILV